MRSSEHRSARALVASLAFALGCATHRAAPVVPAPAPTNFVTASWYGPGFHGRRTASGERFDANGMSAAHPTLPFGTHLCVTNVANGRSVRVRVTDRGPFRRGRSLDLSYGAARRLGILDRGTARVRVAPAASCGETDARR
ncbi:MAG TPA: septal ring lytic transglycosylase RlpA family protein [Candidatus Binatia bacterium]|nr:septal ring lytic transglycosylase RlpA family protein [Candidatus Binatia bacterium]